MLRALGKPIRMIRKAIYAFRNRWFDEFIFIHINKTGGSSVENALYLAIEHKTAREKIRQVGRNNWDRKVTFTIVRNPWDKVVSHYQYRVQNNKTNLGRNTIPFTEWVKRTYGAQDPLYYDKPKMFQPQMDWLIDDSGKIAVNHIIRFENLTEEITALVPKLGKKVDIPHLKSSKHGRYQDYYSKETAEIIGRWFARDIQQFGYRFDAS